MASKSGQPEVGKVDIEEQLDYVDKTLDRVKVLYEQYFLGMQKQPPTHIHGDVERRLRDLMQVQIRNTGLRYRFATLQQKFGSYNSYWRRTVRQIENGTYIRNLSKISRQAAITGEEIPEEILAAMPKRMREQVKRDREMVLATKRRRDGQPDDEFAEEPPPGAIGEVTAERNAHPLPRNFHVLDEGDADLDFDKMFASMTDDTQSEAPAFLDPEPTPPRAPPPPSQPANIRAATPTPMPRPVVPAPPRTTGSVPTVPAPGARTTQPVPVVPRPARPTGPTPTVPAPGARTTQPGPTVPAPGARATQPVPTVPAPGARTTQPVPTVPAPGARTTQPVPVVPSPAPGPGTSQRIPFVPAPGVRAATGPMPAVPRPAAPAPSQGTRPIPVAPGASQARPAVPVETMSGPFPRTTPAPPPAPRPPAPPAQRPPPGMNDADVNALHANYVKAKAMIGESAGPGSYGKLLQTINAQAPKIMEQYKAKGVEFSVVVKDNQVIIKAKPKP